MARHWRCTDFLRRHVIKRTRFRYYENQVLNMNVIDIENIQGLIKWWNAAPMLRDGGVFNPRALSLLTVKELQNVLEVARKDLRPRFKELVDTFFKKYGRDGDNIIPLTCAHAVDGKISACDCFWDEIEINPEHDGLYHPVYADPYIELRDEGQVEAWNEIIAASKLLGIPDAAKYWKTNRLDDELSESWYGVIGIMKDYKAVAFLMRSDGLLINKDTINEGCNSILFDFTTE